MATRFYALLLLLVTLPASAEPYVGVSLGTGKFDMDMKAEVHSQSYDVEDSMTPGLIAGYRWGSLALEGQYTLLGMYEIRNGHAHRERTANVQSLALLPTVRWGCLYLQAGGEVYAINMAVEGSPDQRISGGLVYGGGLELPLGRASIRLGYAMHDNIRDRRLTEVDGIERVYAAVTMPIP